jgi:membrane protein YdbS with pleckstrin-like domain
MAAAGSLPPTPVVTRYLFGTEEFRGEWRRHWTFLWRELLAVSAATLLLGYLAGTFSGGNIPTALGLLWLAVAVWATWRCAGWWWDRFVLTNKRVMMVSGLLTRRVAMMPLKRVTDMAYEQGLLGRWLNYGTFVLESAGQDQALRVISHLPRPNELYLHICEEMYSRASAHDNDEDA